MSYSAEHFAPTSISQANSPRRRVHALTPTHDDSLSRRQPIGDRADSRLFSAAPEVPISSYTMRVPGDMPLPTVANPSQTAFAGGLSTRTVADLAEDEGDGNEVENVLGDGGPPDDAGGDPDDDDDPPHGGNPGGGFPGFPGGPGGPGGPPGGGFPGGGFPGGGAPGGGPPGGPPGGPLGQDADDQLLFRRTLASVVSIDRSVHTLAQHASRGGGSTRSNLKDPDTFDGDNPAKLRPFLTQIYLHFAERPRAFATDDDKIIYTLSYLRGLAAEWFTPYDNVLGGAQLTRPHWDGNFALFVQELIINFGPHDPVGDAESRIRQLKMKDTERFTKYLVNFNRHAVTIGWGDRALMSQLYEGLPARIKDELALKDAPTSLSALRLSVMRIDHRYWRREEERRRENKSTTAPKPKSSDKSPNTTSHSSSSHSNPRPAQSGGSASTAGRSASAPAGGAAKSATAKPYADKLGNDGKLKKEERERRLREKLCLYCGGAGHMSKECRHRSASARATEVTPAAESK